MASARDPLRPSVWPSKRERREKQHAFAVLASFILFPAFAIGDSGEKLYPPYPDVWELTTMRSGKGGDIVDIQHLRDGDVLVSYHTSDISLVEVKNAAAGDLRTVKSKIFLYVLSRAREHTSPTHCNETHKFKVRVEAIAGDLVALEDKTILVVDRAEGVIVRIMKI